MRSLMPGERVNGACSTGKPPLTPCVCPTVSAVGLALVAWCEASLEILHVHPLSLSVLQELQRGAERALYAAANRRGRI
ncbi:hypothetical protein KZ774_06845 [Escherichia coli]|nr:hypothetical protein [Escherichia coli]